MAFDSVNICNWALHKIGKGTISTLDADNEVARRCNFLYDNVRRSELSANYWNFAMKRAELSYDATAPAFEWSYRYQKPTDCLTIKEFYLSQAEWIVEGDYILTNDDVVYLRYVKNESDTTVFHPLFVEALACKLAYEFVGHEGDAQLRRDIYADYQSALLRAEKIGALERKLSLDKERGETQDSERMGAGR